MYQSNNSPVLDFLKGQAIRNLKSTIRNLQDGRIVKTDDMIQEAFLMLKPGYELFDLKNKLQDTILQAVEETPSLSVQTKYNACAAVATWASPESPQLAKSLSLLEKNLIEIGAEGDDISYVLKEFAKQKGDLTPGQRALKKFGLDRLAEDTIVNSIFRSFGRERAPNSMPAKIAQLKKENQNKARKDDALEIS